MNKRKQIKEYINKVIAKISTFVPLLIFYRIEFTEEEKNPDGGWISVYYASELFNAEFYVYNSIFEEMPEKGLTRGFKNYVKISICHEVGHLYIWRLEGTKRDIERTATLIGKLIFEQIQKI